MSPEKPEPVDQSVKDWRQGDVFGLDSFVHIADPSDPRSDEAKAETKSPADAKMTDEWLIVISEVEAAVVISQTCDVIDPSSVNPFVEVAPLVRLEEPFASQAIKGGRPRYAHVPAVNAFADLERIQPIEKPVLVRFSRTAGVRDDQEQRRFAEAVGRHFNRFAFPTPLYRALKPLSNRIDKKYGQATFDQGGKNETKEGQALAALDEIRIGAAPSWSADPIDLYVFFLTQTRESGLQLMPEGEWQQWVNFWLDLCRKPGGSLDGTVYRSLGGEWVGLDELNAYEYLASDRLDFDRLTAEGAADE